MSAAAPESAREVVKRLVRWTIGMEHGPVQPRLSAGERSSPPAEIRESFEMNGLRMVHHELYRVGLGAPPEPAYRLFLEPLQRQRWFGHDIVRRQLVVATPA